MKKYKLALIIDDDKVSNLIAENALQTSGVVEKVISVLSIEESITFLQKLDAPYPDVIFLDLNFPTKLNGWYFLENLAQIIPSKMQSVDIYMFTSSISKKDIERAMNTQQLAGFISKPLNQAKIMEFFLNPKS
ncbi:MAG: response regulator [Microscillaceae bacterium]|jgi:CheY-like chemotaxis protein|nr:response regulator [Microscillaceae bacterium]